MLYPFLVVLHRSSRRTPCGRTPLAESGHAAFPHPALHMADLLSNLCVFNTFLLKKVVFLLLQSLSIAQVTFLVIAICGSLPSRDITHIHQYYEAIRLPIPPLLLFFWLSKHTPFLFSKIEKV